MYDNKFYTKQSANKLYAANVILDIVSELFTIFSVVDVGCGIGYWLSAAHKKGITDITVAKEILKWEPTIQLDRGLLNTIAYFSSIM